MSALRFVDHRSGYAVAIDDQSQVGEARRTATAIATAAGLGESDAGRVAIVASEAATNIVKHAGRGEIVLRSALFGGGVDVIAIDAGPGIPDIDRAMQDGYSTAGSSGTGLGAMARLSTMFDLFSSTGGGTVLAARIDAERAGVKHAPASAFEIGVVRVPKRGEVDCGDDWGITVNELGRAMVVVADGLGHGRAAAEASRRAVELASAHATEEPAMIVAAQHAGMRATRGAAVAVATLDPTRSAVRFAGLGNIAASIVTPTSSRSLVSHNGIAGHEMRKVQEFAYDWAPDESVLVMHSDGVSQRWDLTRYPGLVHRHPNVVAGVIYRDFSRSGRDDAVVVVVRARLGGRG